MGRIRIRDGVCCRTVPAPTVDGEITIDLAGEENELTVPDGVVVERR